MTKKQKDMAEFCADFVLHFLSKDDDFNAFDSDVKDIVLGMCAASVAMILKHLGVQPVKKVIAKKPESKKKEPVAKA